MGRISIVLFQGTNVHTEKSASPDTQIFLGFVYIDRSIEISPRTLTGIHSTRYFLDNITSDSEKIPTRANALRGQEPWCPIRSSNTVKIVQNFRPNTVKRVQNSRLNVVKWVQNFRSKENLFHGWASSYCLLGSPFRSPRGVNCCTIIVACLPLSRAPTLRKALLQIIYRLWSTYFKADRSIPHVVLSKEAHVAGWGPYNLHDPAHVCWVGSVTMQIYPARPLSQLSVRNYRWSICRWPGWSVDDLSIRGAQGLSSLFNI